jgi:hypothetical protein
VGFHDRGRLIVVVIKELVDAMNALTHKLLALLYLIVQHKHEKETERRID